MNIVICDYIEQYCKEIDKIIWNMADEFEEHINVVSFNSVQELYKYLKNNKKCCLASIGRCDHTFLKKCVLYI